MRCPHRNVTIEEYGGFSVTWQIRAGAVEKLGESSACETGEIEVTCQDCGQKRAFGRKSKWPKWVKAAMVAIADRQGEPN